MSAGSPGADLRVTDMLMVYHDNARLEDNSPMSVEAENV